MNTCPACSKTITPTDLACPNCGISLNPEAGSAPARSSAGLGSSLVFIGCGIVAVLVFGVLVLGVGSFWFFARLSSAPAMRPAPALAPAPPTIVVEPLDTEPAPPQTEPAAKAAEE